MTIHVHRNPRDDDDGSSSRRSTRQQEQGRRLKQRIVGGKVQSNGGGNPRIRRRNSFFFVLLVFFVGVLSFLWLSMFAHNVGHVSTTTFDYYYSSAATTLNDFVTKSTTTASTTTTTTTSTSATTDAAAMDTSPTTGAAVDNAAAVDADADAGSSSSSSSTLRRRQQKDLDDREVPNTDIGNDRRKKKKKKKIKLQDKLDRFYVEHGYSYNLTDDDGGLWHLSDYVPSWMSQYFDWHKQQLLELQGIFDSSNEIDNNHVVSTLQDSNHKLLVMQCLKTSDNKCGGTADRLKPFLYLLKEAAIMKRILFLHWTSPCDIKDFLVPPIGGFDWRAPTWLQNWLASPLVATDAERFHLLFTHKEVDTFRNATVFLGTTSETSSSVNQNQGRGRRRKKQVSSSSSLLTPSTPIVRTRLQSITGFDKQYNEHPFVSSNSIGKVGSNTEKNDDETAETEPAFEDVYHDVWRIAFRPSRPVAELIEQEFVSVAATSSNRDNLDNRDDNSGFLIPNRFVGVHLRAMYGSRAFRTTTELMDMVWNGLNCGSMHRYHNNNKVKVKSDEYFFASDLGHALELAQEYGTSKKVSVHVVHGVMENQGLVPEKSLAAVKEEGHQHADGPLHFAKADNLHSRQPSEFYSTFVDLFILGMGRCTIVNRGGFGTFGALISYNSTCTISQKTSTKGIQHRCDWTDHHDKDEDGDGQQHQQPDLYVDETINNGRWWPPPLFLDPMP